MDSTVGLTDVELRQLTETRSEREWNACCDGIKSARAGRYPHDWFVTVLASGLMSRISGNWR